MCYNHSNYIAAFQRFGLVIIIVIVINHFSSVYIFK